MSIILAINPESSVIPANPAGGATIMGQLNYSNGTRIIPLTMIRILTLEPLDIPPTPRHSTIIVLFEG